MLNVVKKLGSLGASLTLFGAAFAAHQASAKTIQCARGFTCTTKCPAADPGTTLVDLTCDCDKDKPNNVCIAKGVCNEHSGGKPTGVTKPCECLREDTMAHEVEQHQL
jgi:hypothetical protein